MIETFWEAHDPTTLNRQGNDSGTQYRSGIYYQTDEQKAVAEKVKAEVDKSGKFKNPIVTEIVRLDNYCKAEDYHQNYFNQTGDRNPYCTVVIRPKLQKLLSKGLIREEPYLK